jgi:hypothetical protein
VDQAQQARRPVAQLSAGGRPYRQGGWVGLVVILIALVIVAVLAERALKGYGMLDGAAGNRVPPAASGANVDPTVAPTTAGATLDRARNLEKQMQREEQEQRKHIDEQTQ